MWLGALSLSSYPVSRVVSAICKSVFHPSFPIGQTTLVVVVDTEEGLHQIQGGWQVDEL